MAAERLRLGAFVVAGVAAYGLYATSELGLL
jgi:hypothetical protein